jgi:hypothetical protein
MRASASRKSSRKSKKHRAKSGASVCAAACVYWPSDMWCPLCVRLRGCEPCGC